MPATTATIEERVQRGAMLLDSTTPGWAGRIDADNLEMSQCGRCVLGHLFGMYSEGVCSLELFPEPSDWPHTKPAEFGFYHTELSLEDGTKAQCEQIAKAEYAALRTAWLAEIRLRLAPDDEPEPALAGVAAGRDNAPEAMP